MMRMRDVLKSSTEKVAQIAAEERAKARTMGTSSYHADQDGHLIEDHPDGRRTMMQRRGDKTNADAAE